MARTDPKWRLGAILADLERLPLPAQWLLVPCVWLAMLLSVWRAALVLIGLGAGVVVSLKVHDPSAMTWARAGFLATAVVWLPVALGYAVASWVAIGTIPFALATAWRCWRRGEPFHLADPALVLPAATLDRLNAGKPLTAADLEAIVRRSDAGWRQGKLALIIAGVAISGTAVGVSVAGRLGWSSEDGNAGAMIWAFATLGPLALVNGLGPDLWCLACGRRDPNLDFRRLAATGLCPRCDKPGPMTTRRPAPGKPVARDDDLA